LAPLWNMIGEELCWVTSANATGLFDLPAIDLTQPFTDGG
jgi:hypothetical protein